MNEFIVKEKHKYWDNKITLEEYIKNTEESGYIDCSSDYDYEFWYILENLKKLNNLQSKIDKTNELLEELEHNQNINLEKGLENRVDVDYVIERLNDCIGDDK